MNKCWCNKGQLAAFSDAYAVCNACKTLVSKKSHDAFNEKNFPKRQHVSSYSEDSLAKSLLWLTTILKYKDSPVTLFDVSGIQQEFSAIMQSMQCDVFQTSKSGQLFDVVILINTLEYQTNPQATIKDALNALKPDGLLLIQTPNYPGLAEKNILQQEHAFASPLMTREARYLFNQASVQLLLKTLNLAHVEFQHTNKQLSDMLFVTSRVPLLARSEKAQTKSFNSTTAGRLISALATKQTQLQRLETQAQTLQVFKANDSAHLSDIEALRNQLHISEEDRRARLVQIETLTAHIEKLSQNHATQIESTTTQLADFKANAATHCAQIETLTQALQTSETDRAARLTQIQTLGNQLQISETDRSTRLAQIESLTAHIHDLSKKHITQIEHLTEQLTQTQSNAAKNIEKLDNALQTSENDRAAQNTQIQTLGNQLQISETDRSTRLAQIESLTTHINDLSKKHVTQIEHLTEQLTQTQSNAAKNIEKLANALQTSETDRAAQNTQINILHKNNNLQLIQVKTLTAQIKELQQKHAQKMEYMFAQLTEAKATCSAHLTNIEKLTQTLQTSETDCAAQKTQISILHKDNSLQLIQIKTLTAQIKELQLKYARKMEDSIAQLTEAKATCSAHLTNIEKLTQTLQTSETDCAAQKTQISILHKDNSLQLIQVKTLTKQIEELQLKHRRQMEHSTAQLTEAKVSCSAHLTNIERLTQTLQSSENNCKILHHQLKATEKNHKKQFDQIKTLEKQMQAFEQHHTMQIAQVIAQLKEAKSNRSVILRNLVSTLKLKHRVS